jgi:drug/metabolite transporter (DMT)-like permease
MSSTPTAGVRSQVRLILDAFLSGVNPCSRRILDDPSDGARSRGLAAPELLWHRLAMTSAAKASRLKLIATAALFSTGGAAIKSCALTSWQVAAFRSGIACVAFLAMVPAARRLLTWRELLVGIGYAASMVFFVTANKLTTSANAIFLQSTAPIYILFLAPLFLHERITRRDLLFLVCVGAGVLAFFIDEQQPLGTAPNPFLGNAIALASGLTWALTVIGMRWLSGAPSSKSDGEPTPALHADEVGDPLPAQSAKKGSPPTAEKTSDGVGAVVAGNAMAFLLCIGPALASPIPEDPAGGPWRRWIVITYLGVFQIALAYVLLTSALRNVQAFEASVLLLIEPVLNPVWAFFVHGERPGVWALAGGLVIVTATAIKTWWDGRVEAASAVLSARCARSE